VDNNWIYSDLEGTFLEQRRDIEISSVSLEEKSEFVDRLTAGLNRVLDAADLYKARVMTTQRCLKKALLKVSRMINGLSDIVNSLKLQYYRPYSKPIKAYRPIGLVGLPESNFAFRSVSSILTQVSRTYVYLTLHICFIDLTLHIRIHIDTHTSRYTYI
jgi:hypothetical protein